ncbi:MAG: permease [Tissierellia bacterium]|nr:permease [Tissierellia bacterium]
MDIFTLIVWIMTLSFLLISFLKDKAKTKDALKMAFGLGKGMVLNILVIIFIIGIILTVLPPESIAQTVSQHSVFISTIGAALFGTITLVPAFIAFPLAGKLMLGGVNIMPIVSFLTTLTMVGVVTMPLEREEFGNKFTIVRNGLSFLFAIIIALLMGLLI